MAFSWFVLGGGIISGIILEKLQKYILKGYRLRRFEKKRKHWILSPQIKRKDEIITMSDGKKLQAYVYSSDITSDIAPAVLFLHGYGGFAQDFNFESLLSSLCLAGYRIFAYDYRASGRSREKGEPSIFQSSDEIFIDLIFKDVNTAINWMYNHKGVNKENVNLIGASLGGAMALSYPLHDEKLKKIIGICTPHDFSAVFREGFVNGPFISRIYFKLLFKKIKDVEKFLIKIHEVSPEVKIREDFNYSNRVFLAHCQDDEVIPFGKHFIKNVEKLRLPSENTLIFERGGHEFKGNTAPLVARMLYWLKK